MTHQTNEGEAPEKPEVADFERRFAELIRRFWHPPRPPAPAGKDEAE
jgi:hypothetical protein